MQKIIDNMRGRLTCLVVFALMVMTPFADPQIALASDYAAGVPWSQMETEQLEGDRQEWYLENSDVNKSVEGQLLAMSAQAEMPAENELTEVMDASVESELAMNEPLSMEAEVPIAEESVSVNKGPIIHQKQSIPRPQWRIKITTEELDLLERCVMAEGGGESYDCQVAIACVIINRVLSDKYPDSVEDVIKQKGQFSTWPEMIKRMVPTNEVKQAVREALASEVIPENVLYFRANRYHRWGSRYCRMDNTYFSTP